MKPRSKARIRKGKLILPKPAHRLGYYDWQLVNIAGDLRIPVKTFNDAFGNHNTLTMDEKGKTVFFERDVRNAIHKVLTGKELFWD